MRLVTDLFAYAGAELPAFNTISISGYHIREAGSTAAQEIAFTIANGISYVRAAVAAGLDIDVFAPRLSFFWNSHNHFFEEIAKFRAARRVWADLMKNQMGALDPRSWAMRFHTQTAGSTLTAQQPDNNVVRTTVQAMAAVLGGTQSLHTNSFDEALGLPTEASARLALRTQQILAYESGLTDTVDPLAGSYFIEALTDDVESAARSLLDAIEKRGGSVAAIETGWMQSQIEDAAYVEARRQESGESMVIGVNKFAVEAIGPVPALVIDPDLEADQVERLSEWKRGRDQGIVSAALEKVSKTATTVDNLLYPMKEALVVGATVGEVSNSLRRVFGSYRP
jgi:methylmalonyl-CoA mutase N-terminal domain/subunit